MQILRIDMSALTSSFEDLPEEWKILGGRGLSAKILTAEVPPETDPLSAEARLVFANGPLAGTMAPSFGRMSVGAKSPLTMGIKEANVGGTLSQKLDKLGIRAIIVQGAPAEGKLHLVKIHPACRPLRYGRGNAGGSGGGNDRPAAAGTFVLK